MPPAWNSAQLDHLIDRFTECDANARNDLANVIHGMAKVAVKLEFGLHDDDADDVAQVVTVRVLKPEHVKKVGAKGLLAYVAATARNHYRNRLDSEARRSRREEACYYTRTLTAPPLDPVAAVVELPDLDSLNFLPEFAEEFRQAQLVQDALERALRIQDLVEQQTDYCWLRDLHARLSGLPRKLRRTAERALPVVAIARRVDHLLPQLFQADAASVRLLPALCDDVGAVPTLIYVQLEIAHGRPAALLLRALDPVGDVCDDFLAEAGRRIPEPALAPLRDRLARHLAAPARGCLRGAPPLPVDESRARRHPAVQTLDAAGRENRLQDAMTAARQPDAALRDLPLLAWLLAYRNNRRGNDVANLRRRVKRHLDALLRLPPENPR